MVHYTDELLNFGFEYVYSIGILIMTLFFYPKDNSGDDKLLLVT